ncbi:MAG: hypothetical protein ABIH25_04090 [Candidatus Woesearchaeota archaeon]
MKNNILNIKKELIKNIKEIKSIWIINEDIYILIPDSIKKEKKEIIQKIKKITKDIKINVLEIDELFREITDYNKKLLIDIRDGDLLYDKLGFIKSIKINIREGNIVGTKESLFRKFVNIEKNLKEIEQIKREIISNLYTSAIEASQAMMLASGLDITTQKKVPIRLKKLYKREIIDKESLNLIKEIIKAYKNFEYIKSKIPSPEILDNYIKKMDNFLIKTRNAIYK